MAPPVRGSRHPITAYYSVYRPTEDERLSWPSCLTCSGRFTHISGQPSAAACRSSAGQEKFAGRRPKFYHSATPPTKGGGEFVVNVNKFFFNYVSTCEISRTIITSPPVVMRSIASVCLFVCPFALACVSMHVQFSPNFLYMLPVPVVRFSACRQCQLLGTSGFVDNLMFFRANGQNERRRVSFVEFARWRHRAKSAVTHCISFGK